MSIQREQVVQTALALLDEGGVEGLTMRKLAQKLNIQAPSLYWHFANKQALLEGMADALLEPVARTVMPQAPWEEVLATVASELRLALGSRRDGARVFAGTYIVTENVLRVSEAMMGALRGAGASHRTASWGSFSILYYVLGFAMEEQALDPRWNPGTVDIAKGREQFAAESPTRFPHVLATLEATFDGNFDARFEFGLKCLIAGLKTVL
ncbi:TetR/AcrR family transcriptional regulator C-terminal domain-containing protein [Stigmatella aurantiaca]|uniref:Tetracycline resistance regulatory protein TetR n=1 Tax=Stigmatella aurantiaca (strain DW4/3-1) TaxID=378806 RepID=Q08V54_STIAD|nr:TetR/AcrR family transcriptional regulator C-terminal domain-containing protein [Stigmatella aurantiaca]ADO74983.1 Tetracycline resistance regulatory protein TetR [Stigmatella aurantiaca DW4/3-1]EAU64375.1 tetracycline resistance regulatory protein TetR [Stigmatella aurantiaca DW4/3-1]